MTDWYIIANANEYGPFTIEKLKGFAASGKLKPTVKVRSGKAGEWTTADTIPGLFNDDDAEDEFDPERPRLLKCGVCEHDMASNAPACPNCGAPNNTLKQFNAEQAKRKKIERAPSVGKKTSKVLWSIVTAVVLFGVLLLLNWAMGPGSPKSAVASELDKWKRGEPSSASEAGFYQARRPILVNYEIIGVDDGAFGDTEVTVQLMFTTGAGGKPVALHKFRLAESASGEWKIKTPYRYR